MVDGSRVTVCSLFVADGHSLLATRKSEVSKGGAGTLIFSINLFPNSLQKEQK